MSELSQSVAVRISVTKIKAVNYTEKKRCRAVSPKLAGRRLTGFILKKRKKAFLSLESGSDMSILLGSLQTSSAWK
jgi:hypothetical protein